MNPILAEDIMRKRAHRSVIVLVAFLALAWLLVLPDKASADDPYTVAFINVPIEASGLHDEVTKIKTFIRLYKSEEALNADISIEDWQNWNKGYATSCSVSPGLTTSPRRSRNAPAWQQDGGARSSSRQHRASPWGKICRAPTDILHATNCDKHDNIKC